jgi:hypothetical protein
LRLDALVISQERITVWQLSAFESGSEGAERAMPPFSLQTSRKNTSDYRCRHLCGLGNLLLN